MKAFLGDKINVIKSIEFNVVFKNVGKGENAGYRHFLYVPQCFQKLCLSASLKVAIVWLTSF